MVLAACREAGTVPSSERFDELQDRIELPDVCCIDLTAWSDEVSALSDLVFHDHDWQLADELLDQPPAVAAQLKSHLGIEDDYFTAVVPFPKKAELLRARQSLRDLVRAHPK
jgi:hypothetical protein